ncbi:hypothetical protein Adt_05112 [Abeliophyllum distichum]|uniref:Uncharacterized protein n=1 Tax=Abeliophyllum distichum TaxID=126358 RepID=A0ABD1V362_9LAMI
MGEVSSSPEGHDEVDQRPTVAHPPLTSTSGRRKSPGAPQKSKVKKKQLVTRVSEIRVSFGQREIPAARQLDEELTNSVVASSMVYLRIKEANLDDIRLSYDISELVVLTAPGG